MNRKGITTKVPLQAFLIAFLLAIVSTVLLADTAYSQPGIKVSGALVEIEVNPGVTYLHSVKVTNNPASPPLNIVVTAGGFGYALNGAYHSLAETEDLSPYSALGYITEIDKPSFHLDPGQSTEVSVRIHVPEDMPEGSRYAMIHIESLPLGTSGVGYVVAADVPIKLTRVRSNLSRTGRITEVMVPEVLPGKPIQVSTILENTGNHHYKAHNDVIVTDSSGQVVAVASSGLTSSDIIPPFSRQFDTFPLWNGRSPELPEGTYHVQSRVFLEDGTLLDEATTDFTVRFALEPCPGIDPARMLIVTFTDQEPFAIDARAQADLEIAFSNDIGRVTGTVLIGKHRKPPETVSFSAKREKGGAGQSLVKMAGVRVEGFTRGTAFITLHYTDGEVLKFDEKSLFIAFWNGEKWQDLHDISVYTGANQVTGSLPVSALQSCTPLALGGERLEEDSPVSIQLWMGIAVPVAMVLVGGGLFVWRRRRTAGIQQ